MPVKKASPERRPEGMGGLAKGLAVIEAFGMRDAMSVADAARVSGATRAAARRCLLTLTELGYIEHTGRDYRALPRLRALGGVVSMRDRLAKIAQPFLDRTRDQLDESVSLAVLDGENVLFIARAEAKHIVSVGVKTGGRLPVYCSATGRVLLADMPNDKVAGFFGKAPLPRRTPRTRTSVAEILDEIQRTAASGHSLSDEEIELGLRALAVPVKREGKTIAAVSVSASSSRVPVSEMRKRFLSVLEHCANSIAWEATDSS